uniref:RRM domain-containing protein n=1 Tax=Alexandrium catenella TaxID=2925 RepID=A0A7S1QX78_ALECA
MAILAGVKVVVKNTFLEVAEFEDGGADVQIRRCQTEPAIIRFWSEVEGVHPADSDTESVGSASGTASTASCTSKSSTSTVLTAPSTSKLATGTCTDSVARTGTSNVDMLPRPRGFEAVEWPALPASPITVAKAPSGAQLARAHRPKAARDAPWTTVMLRNLPNDYTRSMLLDLLDERGFAARYDFVYVPTDFARGAGLGYAFVNMRLASEAVKLRDTLDGFKRWSVPSNKVCTVSWSVDQGLAANIERYRNSPVMHDSVPDDFKPVLLHDGVCADFPEPTKRIRRPTLRKSS